MMSDIFDRISYLVEKEANGKAEKFGELIGFSGQAVRYVSNLKRNKPNFDMISSILQTFVWVNPDWLLWGEEPIVRPEVTNSNSSPDYLLRRVEELAIENNDLKKELCRLTNSKKNNLCNVATEHDC